MGEMRKVLGQAALAATTLTAVYTVPGNAQAVISSLVVCNRSGSARTFRIAVSPNGAAIANEHYLYYDVALPAADAFTATVGLTLGPRDVVRVYASDTNCSVSVFGVEIT